MPDGLFSSFVDENWVGVFMLRANIESTQRFQR